MVTLNRFAWLERVTLDHRLSARAARLASIIALRYANKALEAWPAQSTLAADLGLDRDNGARTVRLLATELERCGYLKRDRQGSGRETTKYTLTLSDRLYAAVVAPIVGVDDALKINKARERARALDAALTRLRQGLSLEIEHGFSQDVINEARASFSTERMPASAQGGYRRPPRADETLPLRADAGIRQTSIENLSIELSASARDAAEELRALARVATKAAA